MFGQKDNSRIYSKPEKVAIPKTAEILSKCVRDMINSLSIVSWQPKVEELQCDERKPPELAQYFYKTLLLSKNKSKTYTRFVDLFSSDMIFSISNGKYATLKQTSLGLGLHSITCMKNSVNILHHLGHSLSYEMFCQTETA